MIDIWEEIWSSLRKNKLRTFLTGFSVAWGIFMLIILLGAGNGLKNGVRQNFGSRSENTISIWPGYTSIPYEGMQKGRRIKLDESDETLLRKQYPNISTFSPTINQWDITLSHGKEYGSYSIRGIKPEYQNIAGLKLKAGNGRFINDNDIRENRKVIVIHERTAQILFRNEPPLGKYIKANNVVYHVVGVYSDEDARTSPDAYIPLTTADIIYNSDGFNQIEFILDGIKTAEDGTAFATDLRQKMGKIHTFDPNDTKAIYIWNKIEWYLQTMGIFNGISLFVWIIGIGTLIAGIVGVSNIMLITVKERTREFGIRKALGATPLSILMLVVVESIVITSFFGYIGMIAGIGLTELVNHLMSQTGGNEEMTIFSNPTVELPIVMIATSILITAGILAGYFPARKAVSIKPIEALRNE